MKYQFLPSHRESSKILELSIMPPQRDFSSKADYMQRNLYDDLLEQLKNSTNNVVKGRELLPKNPRMMMGEGLYHRANFLKDMDTSVGGMDLFRR